MVALGWSLGDIVSSIRIVATVANTLKEAGGTGSRYKQSQDFLTGFRVTLEHLRKYVEENPEDAFVDDIIAQITRIEEPWRSFKSYLEKYEKAFDTLSQRSRLAKSPRSVKWAIKDLSGEVDKLERAISKPLELVNSLLLLQTLDKLGELPKELTPNQFTQLLNATNLPQLTREINTRIETLSRTVTESADRSRRDTFTRELEILEQVSKFLVDFRSETEIYTMRWCKEVRIHSEEQQESILKRIESSERATQSLLEAQRAMIQAMREALERKVSRLYSNHDNTPTESASSQGASNSRPKGFSTAQWTATIFSSLISGLVAAGLVGSQQLRSQWSRSTSVLDQQLCDTPRPRSTASAKTHNRRVTVHQDTGSAAWVAEFTPSCAHSAEQLCLQIFESSGRIPRRQTYIRKGNLSSTYANTSRMRGTISGRSYQLPGEYRYSCVFYFQPCCFSSDDKEEWKTHCLAHFRMRPPPKSLLCPFCWEFNETREDGYSIWELYMKHIAKHMEEHPGEAKLPIIRKDQRFYFYLWQQGLLTDRRLEELRSQDNPEFYMWYNGVSRCDPAQGILSRDWRNIYAAPSISREYSGNNGHHDDSDNNGNDDDSDDGDDNDGRDGDSAADSSGRSAHRDEDHREPDNDSDRGNPPSELRKPGRPRYILPSKLDFREVMFNKTKQMSIYSKIVGLDDELIAVESLFIANEYGVVGDNFY